MIRASDRVIAAMLVRVRAWRTRTFLRVEEIVPRRWSCRLFRRMLRRQARDERHHAPCCPANHFHYQRLVLRGCTCGAEEGRSDG